MPKFKNTLSILTFLVVTLCVVGQDSLSVHKNIVGNWQMVRHTLLEKNILKEMWGSEYSHTYVFNNNGTYTSKYSRKGYGTTITKGKWKSFNNGTKLYIYDNDFVPHIKHTSVGNHYLDILKLTNTEFVTNEYFFSEDPAGTSYYQKKKIIQH